MTAQELALFNRLQPGEQAHSIAVFKSLQSRNDPETHHPDLQAAALLHDVGKCRYRLSLWERVWIVLGRALLLRQVERWGREGCLEPDTPAGMPAVPPWQRPFVVSVQHPEWGAALAAEAGASPLVVTIIRRHQNLLLTPGVTLEDRLLYTLQCADGND